MRRLVTAAVAVVLIAGAATFAARDEPVENVLVYPPPGTDTANPATTISFRGITAERLGDVTVTGAKSGSHSGRLRNHRDGAGASFVPDRPFKPGERVEVAAGVTLGFDNDVTFQVGVPGKAGVREPQPQQRRPAAPRPTEFVSGPDIVAPTIDVEGRRIRGVMLSAPQGTKTTRNGAMITDADGRLIWWRRPEEGRTLANLFHSRLHGQPVLAWYEGRAPHKPGWYLGEWIIVDSSYQEVARISAENGLDADLHELELTDRGTALVLAYQPLVRGATAQGGDADTIVLDGVIQEVDVTTGDVLFEWHCLDHIPLSWSVIEVPDTNLYDYAHINSFEEGPAGNILVSMRHTSLVAEIDRATGELTWVLGGNHATIRPSDDRGISYPHHARWVGDQRLSIFDNGVGHDPQRSRGVVYRLDLEDRRADVIEEYAEARPLYTETQGSLHHSGDDVLAGWGELGFVSVFWRDGGRRTGRIQLHAPSYRMSVADWHAVPADPPDAQVRDARVYVSWNGATDVWAWELLSGDDPGDLTASPQVRSTGFETALTIDRPGQVGMVRALDREGALLGATDPFPLADTATTRR